MEMRLESAAQNYWKVSILWRKGVGDNLTTAEAFTLLNMASAQAHKSRRLWNEVGDLREEIIRGDFGPPDSEAGHYV